MANNREVFSLDDHIKDVRVEFGTGKSGNPYAMLVIEFESGFSNTEMVWANDARYALFTILVDRGTKIPIRDEK